MISQNTKLLAILSILVIIAGFSMLWFGFQPKGGELGILPSSSPQAVQSPSPIASSSAVFGIEGEKAVVSQVVDGDTVELSSGQKVRLVGIDTPETVDPRRPVGCFGKEASNETKILLTGREVILQKDVTNTDKYNRLLRYIYLPLEDGKLLFVNDYLVREGFAKVYTYPPDVKYNSEFLEAQKEAQENNRGLWGRC